MASLVLCTAAALGELSGSVWSCSSFSTGSLRDMMSIRRSLSSVLLCLLTPGFCYFLVPSLQHDIHVPCDRAVLLGEAWKAGFGDQCVLKVISVPPGKKEQCGIQLHLNVGAHRSGLPDQGSAHPPRAEVGTRMLG